MSVLQLDGEHLTIDKIKDFLENSECTIESRVDEYKRVDGSRSVVENIIGEEKTIYGITTGFGLFCDVLISKEKVEDLQINLIRSHACGVCKPFGEPEALLMMVFRLNTMLKGHSGVTRGLVEQLKLYINKRIIPVVPEQGSLGASGDLAPLSHMALTLIGEGEVFFMGERKNTRDVLESLGIESITLQAKEGLALINGTQPMTAQGVVNYIEADKLMHDSLWIASLTHQALNG